MRNLLLAIIGALIASSLPAANTPITTVILVRHAEKAGDSGDVPLSAAGNDRARELARVLAGTSIAAIYVTPYVRAEQTAHPLATAHHLDPVTMKNMDTYARDVVNSILRDHKGQTVVVIGHSNTTPQVIRTLGIPNPPEIADSAYDDLFVVTIADGGAKLLSLRYGSK